MVGIIALALSVAPDAGARRLRVLIHADAASARPGVDTLTRFSRLRAEIAAMGARVTSTREWPGSRRRARNFDVVFLLGPGQSGLPSAPEFTPPQVDDLVATTCAGGRIVILTDLGAPSVHRVVNALLRDLLVGIRVTDARYPVEHLDAFVPSVLTAGLDHIDGRGLALLSLSGTEMPLTNSLNGTCWAVDVTPRCAGLDKPGHVVVLGDLDVLDDDAAARSHAAEDARWSQLVSTLLSRRDTE